MTQWAPVHTFYIACGVGGAMVNVTADVLTDQGGITRTVGRTDPFSDFPGGSFSFTIDNRTGGYTPDTPNAGAIPLSEGMVVAWQTDTRLVSGRIGVSGLQLILPDPGVAASARIRVTVADVVAREGRHNLRAPLAGSMVLNGNPYLYWPLNDPSGSTVALPAVGTAPMLPISDSAGLGFGTAGVPGTNESQLQFGTFLTMPAGGAGLAAGQFTSATTVPIATPNYPVNSWGFWGFWLTPSSAAGWGVTFAWGGAQNGLQLTAFGPTGIRIALNINSGVIASTVSNVLIVGVPAYVSANVTLSGTTYTVSLYVNGVLVAAPHATSANTLPTAVTYAAVQVAAQADGSSVQHLSHTPLLVHEEIAGVATEATRLLAIAAVSPAITFAAPPAALSTAPLAPDASNSGQSVLDLLNDIVRTEQGQIYATTTGTVTAPIEQLTTRERTRPTAVTAVWVAGVDIAADAGFVRDLSNTVSEVTAITPTTSATVDDAALFLKVDSASTSINVLSNTSVDAFGAASDRLNRGRKTGFDVPTYSIIGISPLANRSTDLLALTLGDRHQVAGLAQTQFGSTTRDGWLCGWSEYWDAVTATFTLSVETATQTPAIYDTDRYMDSGELTLAAAISSTSAVTFSVATTGAIFTTSAGDLPLTIQIDAEQMTVTNVTAATPQVFTVTRGVNGTNAATHLIAATVSLVSPTSIYAY